MDRPLDLPIYNNYTLNLPAWFATATKNYGNAKEPVWFALANPMTTSRNISNRKHEHSIDIARKSIAKPELVKNQWDNSFEFYGNAPKTITLPQDFKKDMTLEHFSEIDQVRIKRMQQHPNKNFAVYPVLARGRPEELPKNVIYNRHHGKHSTVQKYGMPYLEKVNATNFGRPIDDGEESAHPSPSSSRTPTARSGTSSSGSKSRLSSLASSLRSSSRGSHGGFEPANDSEEDSDSGSDSESDDEDERQAERNRQRGLFGRNPLGSASGSSKSGSSKSGSSRPSVSRGKPPLKRPEPKPKTIAGTTAPKPKPKPPKRVVAYHPKEAWERSSSGSSEASEAPAPVRRPVNIREVLTVPDLSRTPTTPPKTKKAKGRNPVELVIEETDAEPPAPKPKGKTRWAKPTSSQGDEPLVQKARGRKPKYATKEEAYQAKLEQNKIGKQKKAEAKRKAKEDAGATTGTGIKKKRIHGVDYVLEIDESAPVEHLGPKKEETQEERRFKFEEEQRQKHVENLTANTEKLREKEEKRLAKVSAKAVKPVKILTEKQIKAKLAREKLKAKKEGIRAEHARITSEKWEKERPEREKREMLEKKASEEYREKWKKPHALYDKVVRLTEPPNDWGTPRGVEYRELSLTEALMELIPKWKPNKSDTDKLKTYQDFINHGKDKIYPYMPLWRPTTKSYAPDYGENTFMGDFFLKWSKTVK
jgi:hypothetical protein